MAVQYANIIQSLSMMLESRARREQAEEQAALQGLRIAQQDKQFQQEYALKQQQFQQQQQEFFIQQGELLRGQAEKYALEEGLGLAQAEFAPLVEGYLEKKDDGFELRGLKKDGTSDFSKILVKKYGMSTEESVELVNQLSALYVNEAPTVQVIERTVDNWERLTKTTLSNAQNFRLYRQRYRELGEELNDIQTGDYKFDTQYSILPEGQDFVDSESAEAILPSASLATNDVVNALNNAPGNNQKEKLTYVLDEMYRNVDGVDATWNAYQQNYVNVDDIKNLYDLSKAKKHNKKLVKDEIALNDNQIKLIDDRIEKIEFGGPDTKSKEELLATKKLYEYANELNNLELLELSNEIANIRPRLTEKNLENSFKQISMSGSF
tara:strand:- start:11614 stop:12753 length:1140 start_codon:yes stop_codon:yes gene_type:complete